MWQAEFKLYLCPVDPELKSSAASLLDCLRSLEFIDDEINAEKGNNVKRYKAGDEFLSLICFMGCSPNIELEPQADSPYCYVEIPEQAELQFFSGVHTKVVNCPECKKPQPELVQRLNDIDCESMRRQTCTLCGQHINLEKINWRKSAFAASSWILIGNIYEAEAVPDEKLLVALQQVTGCEWKYAYIRNKH